MDNREILLQTIMQYKFAINDLTLYLDTHQNDRNALRLHNNYAEIQKKLIKEYEEKYGPLTSECPMEKWNWVEDSWPWERGYNE